MLVLSRSIGQQISIGENIVLSVVEIRGDKVRLGFDAPAEVPIVRDNAKRKFPHAPPAKVIRSAAAADYDHRRRDDDLDEPGVVVKFDGAGPLVDATGDQA